MPNEQRAGLRAVYTAWWWLIGIAAVVGIILFGIADSKKMFAVAFSTILILFCVVVVGLFSMLILSGPKSASKNASFDSMANEPSAQNKTEEWLPGDGDQSHLILIRDKSSSTAVVDSANPQPRVRNWFPETLLWQAEAISDENGIVEREIELADSITTWRLSASAVNSQGKLGSAKFPIRVFQPFFVDVDLPVSLTRNDEVSLPVVVYNYSDQKQKVKIALVKADWFELISDDDQESKTEQLVELAAGEVRSISYRVKVLKVGEHHIEVKAISGNIGDAVRRKIEVISDGRRVEQVVSDVLDGSKEFELLIPENRIEGSSRSIFKIYPNSFSQVMEGLDSIFKMPSGCFEQTSSTTYPNILALDYLRKMKQNQPAIEAKARQYLHVGYQRLVTFEVDGGGFSWYGQAPASITLTAYGLMEFQDMARLRHVDPMLIQRTRNWLLKQRNGDGSWNETAAMFHAVHENQADAKLLTTAYIAWAVYDSKQDPNNAKTTIDFLKSRSAKSIRDPYVLAMVINALQALGADKNSISPYLAELESLKKVSSDNKLVWWEKGNGSRTTFYGAGLSSNIETTALAILAMRHDKTNNNTIAKAMNWIIKQKDAYGTWHSTQATVLALKALVSGADLSLADDKTRVIEITIDGKPIRTVTIEKDQSDVMQFLDLSSKMKIGKNKVKLTDLSDTSTKFQVVHWYHVPEKANQPPENRENQPLQITIEYDRESLNVNDHVSVVAKIKNRSDRILPMIILDLPIPGGFAIESAELAELQKSGKIDKFEITARRAIVYLRQLEPKKQIKLNYRLRATMPVKVTVPVGKVYEYYNPATKARSKPTKLEAKSKT